MKRIGQSLNVKLGMIFITMSAFVSASSYAADAIDYDYVNSKVFSPYCLQCHSAAGHNKGGINLETYANVTKNLAKVKKEALVEQAMPPSGPLDSDVAAILSSWIAAGAPQTVETTPTTPNDPSEPTTPDTPDTPNTPSDPSKPTTPVIDYAYVNANVIKPYCLSCHSVQGGNKGGLNFESYNNVVKYIKKIKKEAITEQAMPPTEPLPSAAIDILNSWIDAGTPQTVTNSAGE